MRIHCCRWLLGLSLLFSGVARGQVVFIEGQVGLASKDFGERTVVRVRAGAVLRAEPGSTVELTARRFVFEGPVTVDASGAPGEAGKAAPDSTDTRVQVEETTDVSSWATPISPSCALSELDRGVPGLPGKPGTPGAIVTFKAQDVEGRELVTALVAGGKGGPGGPGGKGRMVRCLTALAPDAGAPEVGTPEIVVLLGPSGPDGPPGQDGADGQVLFNEAPDPGAEPVSFALTVSGGISLGNYEAGYNWALMRQLKKRAAAARTRKDPPRLDLVAVTGASAGSINTFLSALTWCQTAEEDAKESATRNIFHQTWVPIGLPQLIPANGIYSKTDALLSTAAFASVRDTVTSRARERVFREGCVLPIGMTVTRSEPEIIRGESLEAPMDRFAVALEARTVDGTLKFYDSRPEHESAYVRPYLHFTDPASEKGGDAPVAMGDVMKALTASASFPIAFGQQHLSYYAASPTDPSKLTPRSDWFWDGGVFDNIPVGLALSFVEKPLFGRTRPAGRFQLFAIDPERRREVVQPSERRSAAKPLAPRKGLGNLEKIVGNYWSVSRKYELQSFIRFALPRLSQACQTAEGDRPVATGFGSCSGHPLVSSRLSPVFGERLGTFGAFVLQAFREYDFAAGIYDALYAFAQRECEWQQLYEDEPGKKSMGRCVVRRIHAGYEELRLGQPDSALAGYVVKQLLYEEYAQRLGRERVERIFQDIELGDRSAAEWVRASPKGVPAYAAKLLADARRVIAQGHPDTTEDELANIEAVGVLLEGDKSLPKADRDLLASGDWFHSNAMKLLRRADELEREDKYPAGKTVTIMALFLARTSQSLWRTGMQWDPSSVPDATDELEGGGTWHLVPYHLSISFDLVQLGWRPTFGPTRSMAIGLPLSVSGRWGRLRPYYVGAHGGLSLIIRPASTWIPAIELSPLRVTINEVGGLQRPWYGFEVAVYLVGGKMRLAVTADNYALGPWWLPRETMRLTLGIADLNGLLFHLTR